jgi:hypothetical protein
MLAQHARRTRLKTSDRGATLAEVVDARLSQHGVEMDKIAWDAYRRDDGTWRVVATWPSGKSNATAVWELDKARQLVAPQDDMAHYLCGTPAQTQSHRGHDVAVPRAEPGRGGHEPMYGAEPARPGRDPLYGDAARPGRDPMFGADPARRDAQRQVRDPIRAGRDALLASLERPLSTSLRSGGLEPVAGPATSVASAAASGEVPRRRGGARPLFEDEREPSHEVPALAVLRPRRTNAEPGTGERPVKRGPSWDDVLFGTAPTAKDA